MTMMLGFMLMSAKTKMAALIAKPITIQWLMLARWITNMTMPCGNTQAEIDRDQAGLTNAQEHALYAAELNLWKETRDKLLAGETIYTGCAKFTLSERLANEYQEFADLIDLDQDIMNEYLAGKCSPVFNELIKQEASVFASIIVG
jgi:hypothetical protein